MSTDTERRELVRPGATIAYWVSGPEKAPVVVLLHGATLEPRMGCPGRRPRGRYRVVYPTCAATASPHYWPDPSGSTTRSTTSQRCSTRSTPARRSALGGLSLGGNIAQEIVYRDPRPGGRAGRRRLHLQHRAAPPARRVADHRRPVGDDAGRPRAVHGQLVAAATSPRDDVRRYVLDANEDRASAEVVEILASLLNSGLHPEPGYRLPVPTLLLVGADDQVGDIVTGERGVGGARPDGRARADPGCGPRQQPGQPAGVHRRAAGIPGPRPPGARRPARAGGAAGAAPARVTDGAAAARAGRGAAAAG